MGEMVTIPTSTFWLLLLLAIYGLFTSGIMLAVAVTSMLQRHTMWRELRQYNRAISDPFENEPPEEVWYSS